MLKDYNITTQWLLFPKWEDGPSKSTNIVIVVIGEAKNHTVISNAGKAVSIDSWWKYFSKMRIGR